LLQLSSARAVPNRLKGSSIFSISCKISFMPLNKHVFLINSLRFHIPHWPWCSFIWEAYSFIYLIYCGLLSNVVSYSAYIASSVCIINESQIGNKVGEWSHSTFEVLPYIWLEQLCTTTRKPQSWQLASGLRFEPSMSWIQRRSATQSTTMFSKGVLAKAC
jgi:hypothetical protein